MDGRIQPRRIDGRRLPEVAGIDLEHSLNYLDLDEAGEDFIYNAYTSSHPVYRPGSRPVLEALAGRAVGSEPLPVRQVQRLAAFVKSELPWAGYCWKTRGHRLKTDRGMTEEELLESGFGWCNEQARVFCGLTQVLGIPSRLVFAANSARGFGHVVNEALLPEGWLMIDCSFGFCFLRDGRPVRAADVRSQPDVHAYFQPLYGGECRRMADDLGSGILDPDFGMVLADDPLDGFVDLGFHNYFIH